MTWDLDVTELPYEADPLLLEPAGVYWMWAICEDDAVVLTGHVFRQEELDAAKQIVAEHNRLAAAEKVVAAAKAYLAPDGVSLGPLQAAIAEYAAVHGA